MIDEPVDKAASVTSEGMARHQRCKQELCPNWSGDGRVCPCALFDLDPDDGGTGSTERGRTATWG